jgi:Short chain fatty acid transporter
MPLQHQLNRTAGSLWNSAHGCDCIIEDTAVPQRLLGSCPFTMQMVMIIIGGYVVASTPIVYRAIRALAEIPKTPRGAVAMVALFS